MKEKTDLRIQRTQKNLKNALLSLIDEKKIEDITVTELSEKAEINRKTFYAHYPSIQELVYEILEEHSQNFKDTISTFEFFSTDFKINDFIESLNQNFTNNIKLYRSLICTGYMYLFDQEKYIFKKCLMEKFPQKETLADILVRSYCNYIAGGVYTTYYELLILRDDKELDDVTNVVEIVLREHLETIRKKYESK